MKKISICIALLAAIPLASTACSKDEGSSGDGDGDGDGDGSGGMVSGTGGSGDGDGDTGGMSGDGDGDTGGSNMGGGGMGGDGMGGDPVMGGSSGDGDGDLETACMESCAGKVAEGCGLEMNQSACEVACAMGSTEGCEAEWLARVSCEATLGEDDWQCDPEAAFLFAGYTASGEAECGDEFEAYNTCDNP